MARAFSKRAQCDMLLEILERRAMTITVLQTSAKGEVPIAGEGGCALSDATSGTDHSRLLLELARAIARMAAREDDAAERGI
jgi:hypothetical protein